VVKALRYWSDGMGIDSRWGHGGFFPQLPTEPCALESTQPLKMSTWDFSWGKGGRCVRLTTYHPRSAEGQENPGTPWASSVCCGRPLPLPFYTCSHSMFIAKFSSHCCPGRLKSIFWVVFFLLNALQLQNILEITPQDPWAQNVLREHGGTPQSQSATAG
jgi:hypothetical protein